MKRTRSIFKKKFALALSVIMLTGLLPLNTFEAAEAAPSISILAVKDSTGVNATLKNPTSADVSASLIFAAYEPTGQLSYTKEFSVTVGAGLANDQQFDYDIAAHPDYIIKLFAWDSVSFVPLYKETTSSRCITIDGSGVVYDGTYVVADPAVTEFAFVKADDFTKRGAAYTATKSAGKWTYAKTEGIDVVIAYGPPTAIGAALPKADVTTLRVPDGQNRRRVVVSL